MSIEMIKSLRLARQDLAKRLTSLRKEIDIVKIDIDSLDRLIQRYQGQQSLDLVGSNDIANDEDRFRGKTLRESISTILNESYPQKQKASEINKALLDGGYLTTSPNFDSAVFGMLGQMVKVEQIEKAGKGYYKAKQNVIVKVK